MKTLVTGGAGFIGSHLVERLLRDGHEVLVLDDLSTGRRENLSEFSGLPRLSSHEVDVADFEHIQEYFQGIDWVFHLAALADIVPSVQRPLAYHRSNVDGTVSVVEASRRSGVKRFVYAASSSCYGVPEIYPTAEITAIRPQYPYALTKYLGEQIVLHWSAIYNLPAVSLRLFNVFGTHSRTSGTYGAVFGVFLAQKLAGKPFTVVGDGHQTRDFTYVTDVVDAFVRAAECDLSGEIFNIGSGGTYSINTLVELLGGAVVHIPKRPGEPDCTFADITKARSILRWQPTVSFEEGVRRVLDNIEYWRHAPVWDAESIANVTQDWFALLGKTNRQQHEYTRNKA